MTTDQEQPTETTTTTVATSTTTSTTTFSSSASPAAKKKRGADEHWKKSKDDVSSDEEEDGEGGGTGSGEFQRADADTLSKRRIVKARRPAGMEGTTAEEGTTGGGESKPNPFATISLTGAPAAAAAAASSETTPAPAPAPAPASSSGGGGVFGSSFPKINASSILAGAGGGGWGGGGGSGEMIKPGTGPGLGSVPMGFASYKLNPFQAAARDAKSSSLFASLPLKGSELVGSSSKGGASQFGGGGGGGGGVREGEGDEEGIPEDLEAEPNVTFDVPKVQGLKDASYKPLTGEEDEICVLQLRTKLYRLTEINKPTQGKAEAGSGGGGGGVASAPVQRDWVEAGVGQAKILVPQAREMDTTSAPARLVMRREPGTTVLINALLKDPVGVAKHAEKALRLTCLDEKGQPSTFLFRFKLMDEMEQMLQEVHTQLEIAGSGGGDVTDKQKKENEGENAV